MRNRNSSRNRIGNRNMKRNRNTDMKNRRNKKKVVMGLPLRVSCACGFLLLAGSRRACFLFRLLSLFSRFVSTTKATHPNKWKRLQPHRVRSSHWRCIVLAGTQTLQEHKLSGFAPSRKETRTIQECAKRGPVAPPASAEKPSP